MTDKLGVNLTLVLEHIASYDEGDIDSEVIELRFEDESGRDTGCDLDIREVCEEARSVIEAGFVIPPGYTLVPDEPTQKMIDEIAIDDRFSHTALVVRYKAMLKAAKESL